MKVEVELGQMNGFIFVLERRQDSILTITSNKIPNTNKQVYLFFAFNMQGAVCHEDTKSVYIIQHHTWE